MNIDELKKLAGISSFKGLTPYEGSNISVTGNEKAQLMKKNNIKPGTPKWFRLWFAKPYLTGEHPIDAKKENSSS
jgi:hypothetical protein